ncbi:hypothetical protein [Tahibacter caeni]|uniref:hypothetical protein n=1 Tax=Tahibacter caeni TaxID=1453545 RepID=UPI002147DA84|nr:hypothetical protein [Tahibacter caeni]
MSSVPELQLSQSFKLAQRAFAALLDAPHFDASLAMAGRVRMAALDKLDLARLTRWLAWQTFVRNPQAPARIERVDQRLAAGVLHARARLPANGRPALSGTPRRTA